MTLTVTSQDLRAALELAVHAPSIHNTQPWRWEIGADELRLRLDGDRVLAATDPDGHAALLSCGATLRLAVIALTSMGWASEVSYSAVGGGVDPLATIRIVGTVPATAADLALAAAARSRVSDRRLLDAGGISAERLEELRGRSSAEPAAFVNLVAADDTERRIWLTVLSTHAADAEEADPEQEAELRRWVHQDAAADDGIPEWAVPETSGGQRHSDVRQRDYTAVDSPGGLPVPAGVDEHPVFAIVMTPSDTAADHLRAGEVMMQLMLEAAVLGVTTCPVSQVVDHVTGRLRLAQVLGGTAVPQMVLRMGIPIHGVAPAPTPRRPVAAIIDTSAPAT